MIHMSLQQAAQAMHGQLFGVDHAFVGVSTDTRTLPRGALFFALKGPNFDAHRYLVEAERAGAAAVVVDAEATVSGACIRVADTRKALGDLARHWRGLFRCPLVAITGSNGKTTVKEMTASIFAALGRTHATQGNFNNDIGVPLTLFGLDVDRDDYAVVEMGANHPGEIARLVSLAQPDAAVVTNAGPAHLEGFGDLDGVARAKGEMFSGMPRSAVAVINRDDPRCGVWERLAAERPRLSFGIERAADIRARRQPRGTGDQLCLDTPAGTVELTLAAPGKHNVYNALAAAGLALAVGAPLDEIAQGLEAFRPVRGRMQAHETAVGALLFDDTYNANPASLAAGLDVLTSQPGRHWLVLGDMGELGADAAELHAECGRWAREKGIERLIALGPLAAVAAGAFGGRGEVFEDAETLVDALRGDLERGVRILVKGSRVMRMERVVAGLLGQSSESGGDR